MNTLSKNPFNTGSPARGEGFLGRQEIIRNIISFLRKKSQFNLLIFGQRRIGKTSLLRKLQDDPDLRETAFPVYFNLQDKASIELSRLLVEIAGRIVDDLDLKIDLKVEQIKPADFPLYFQNEFIPLVVERLPENKQLLLLFDEFDVLGEVEDVEDDSTVDTFASKKFISFTANLIEDMQAKEYPVKLIFAVGRNYKDLEPKRFGQIMKFGPQEELSYFSKNETFELLKASESIIPFDAGAMKEIYSLTSGHPYFSQCLASFAFDAAEKQKADSVTRDIVRQQIINSIKSYSSGIYWIWDSLSPNHQIILYLMAVLKEEDRPITIDTIREKAAELNVVPVLENLPQTIDKLKTFKFIKNYKQSEYAFYVEFIRKWIAREVSEAEITKLLDQIDEEIGFYLNNARYFFKKKDYRQAVQHYDDILKKSPYHFEALLYTARCYKNLRDKDITYLDKALEFYKKSYELNRHKAKKEYLNLLLEKLKYLEENNRVESEGNEIEAVLKEIQTLDPSNSKIAEKLVELYILENKDISELEYLSNVNEINLENKGLKQLPEDIVLLENLRKLDLRKNEISQLFPGLLELGLEIKWEYDGKDGIFLEGNPLETPPVEIVSQGPEAVRQYFKTLEGEELRAELDRLLRENAKLKEDLKTERECLLEQNEDLRAKLITEQERLLQENANLKEELGTLQKRLLSEKADLKEKLTRQQQNTDHMSQKAHTMEKLAEKRKKLLRESRILTIVIFIFLVVAATLTALFIERSNEAKRQILEAKHQTLEFKRQALMTNYYLAKVFEEKALIALKSNQYKQAWLYTAAALKQKIDKDKLPLQPAAASILLNPEVLSGAFSEKWNSIPSLLAGSHSWLVGSTGSNIETVAFSPDGRTLASGSYDHTIRLWDVSSSKAIKTFTGHSGVVNSVAFSPDGKTIVSASKDKTVRLWDVSSGKEPGKFTGHSNVVNSVAFSTDGKTIASGSYDYTIRLLDVSSVKEIRKLTWDYHNITCVAFSLDGKTLAAGSLQNNIGLWDVSSLKKIYEFTGHSGYIYSVAFSPDGKTIVSASEDKTVRLWDVSSGKELGKFTGHSDIVNSVAFSPDGKTIASGSDDNTIRLWDVSSGKEICKFTGHSDDVNGVAFSPDGKTIASGSDDNTMRLWDVSIFNLFLKTGKPTPLFYTFSEGVEFFWRVKLEGLEYKERGILILYPKKFSPIMDSPAPGQTKFEQILDWAKKQQ